MGDEDKSDESQTQAHRSLRIDDHADDQKEIQLQTQKTKIWFLLLHLFASSEEKRGNLKNDNPERIESQALAKSKFSFKIKFLKIVILTISILKKGWLYHTPLWRPWQLVQLMLNNHVFS